MPPGMALSFCLESLSQIDPILHEAASFIASPSSPEWLIKKRRNFRIVVGDRVHVVYPQVARGVYILLCLIARKKVPSAVVRISRSFPVHVSDFHSVDGNAIRSNA